MNCLLTMQTYNNQQDSIMLDFSGLASQGWGAGRVSTLSSEQTASLVDPVLFACWSPNPRPIWPSSESPCPDCRPCCLFTLTADQEPDSQRKRRSEGRPREGPWCLLGRDMLKLRVQDLLRVPTPHICALRHMPVFFCHPRCAFSL